MKQQHAQLAELVDALVSNTNIFGCAGSTPALGTKAILNKNRFFYSNQINHSFSHRDGKE